MPSTDTSRAPAPPAPAHPQALPHTTCTSTISFPMRKRFGRGGGGGGGGRPAAAAAAASSYKSTGGGGAGGMRALSLSVSGGGSGSSSSSSTTRWIYAIPSPTAPEPELHPRSKPPSARFPAATAPPASPFFVLGASSSSASAAAAAAAAAKAAGGDRRMRVDTLLQAAFEADVEALPGYLTGDPAGVRNREGESLLHLAATSPSPNAPQAIDLLITQGKLPTDARDARGRTPLHALAARRHYYYGGCGERQGPAVLAALLRHGADINAPEPHHQRTPLHLAIASHNLPLARALLQQGADPTRRDGRKETPLAMARRLMRSTAAAAGRGCRRAGWAAAVELLLAHAAGDDDALEGGGVDEEQEEGDGFEEENPLRFVRGPPGGRAVAPQP